MHKKEGRNGALQPGHGGDSPRKCWAGIVRASGALTGPLLGVAGTVRDSESYCFNIPLDPENKEQFWSSCMQMFDCSPSTQRSGLQL